MSEAAVSTAPVSAPRARARGLRGWWKDPWRKPRLLEAFTWAYLAWSILPVLIAIAISFNAGRSNTNIQSLGLRWWIHDPDQGALFQDASLRRAMLQTYILSFTTMIFERCPSRCMIV